MQIRRTLTRSGLNPTSLALLTPKSTIVHHGNKEERTSGNGFRIMFGSREVVRPRVTAALKGPRVKGLRPRGPPGSPREPPGAKRDSTANQPKGYMHDGKPNYSVADSTFSCLRFFCCVFPSWVFGLKKYGFIFCIWVCVIFFALF